VWVGFQKGFTVDNWETINAGKGKAGRGWGKEKGPYRGSGAN